MEINLTLAHFYMFLAAFGGGIVGYLLGRYSVVSTVVKDVTNLKAAVFGTTPTLVVPVAPVVTPPAA